MLLLFANTETTWLFCIMFFGPALVAGAGIIFNPKYRTKSSLIGIAVILAVASVIFSLLCAKFDKSITASKIEQAKYRPKGANVRAYNNKYGVNRGLLTNAVFQVSDNGKKVCFSSGNMQVRLNDTTFTIAQHQYETIGVNDSCRDLLNKWEIEAVDLGNRKWRILDYEEWEYILAHYPHKWATVSEVDGLLIVQNNMRGLLDNITNVNRTNWLKMQKNGAVFLPAAGFYIPDEVSPEEKEGYYTVYGKSAPGRGVRTLIIHFSQEGEPEYVLRERKYISARFVTTVAQPQQH